MREAFIFSKRIVAEKVSRVLIFIRQTDLRVSFLNMKTYNGNGESP